MDHISDTVFHGLSQLNNVEVTDAPRMWFMYRNEFKPQGTHELTELYGNGFSLWASMNENLNIDRSNIEEKIKSHYYDIVVIARTDLGTPYLNLILEHYSADEIIALSGRDVAHIDYNFYGKSTYFIRELRDIIINGIYQAGPYHPEFDINQVYPIHCSHPKEKIQTALPKVQAWSHVKPEPGHHAGYIYSKEQDYYDDYRRSLFGLTTTRGGWESQRHYEIMACRCIPYFPNLEYAPPLVMRTLPKELLIHARTRVDQQGADYFMPGNAGWDEYQELEQRIFDHFVANCTTESMAKYVLDTHHQHVHGAKEQVLLTYYPAIGI